METKIATNKNNNGNYDLDGAISPGDRLINDPRSKNPKKHEISEQNKKLIADSLSCLLADTYTLYLKTQNFHWNVTGANFLMIHELFERQYKDLADWVDLVAERIRALGHRAPGSYAEFTELSQIVNSFDPRTQTQMIEELKDSYETMVSSLSQLFALAEECHDICTADLACRFSDTSQKNTWILQSHLAPVLVASKIAS